MNRSCDFFFRRAREGSRFRGHLGRQKEVEMRRLAMNDRQSRGEITHIVPTWTSWHVQVPNRDDLHTTTRRSKKVFPLDLRDCER